LVGDPEFGVVVLLLLALGCDESGGTGSKKAVEWQGPPFLMDAEPREENFRGMKAVRVRL
jgi:hypothetical protein